MMRGLYETDEAVIAGIRRGDDRALAHLYKLHFPMVSHLILSNNGTPDEAKDIYQEGVIVFYEKIKDNSLELSCQIKTYLYSVCRRLWLKKLAERGRFALKLDDAESYLMLEEDVPQHEENERHFNQMEVAMSQLGEPCRSLLEDYYIRTQSMQEITERFGYTNSDTAKNQKYKCLQRLKKLFFTNYKQEDTLL